MDLLEFAMIDSHFAIFVDLSLLENVSIKHMFEIWESHVVEDFFKFIFFHLFTIFTFSFNFRFQNVILMIVAEHVIVFILWLIISIRKVLSILHSWAYSSEEKKTHSKIDKNRLQQTINNLKQNVNIFSQNITNLVTSVQAA